MNKSILAVGIWIFLFIPFSSESKIVYVKERTSQTNATGASWKESLDSIMRAIDVAGPGMKSGWLKDGTGKMRLY